MWGVPYRHLALYRQSKIQFTELLYVPTMQMLVWCFTATYLTTRGHNSGSVALSLVAGFLLWEVTLRAQVGMSNAFLEEVWSQNLVHLLVSPLRPAEFVSGLMGISVVRSALGIVPASLLAWALYSYNVFTVGPVLILLIINLIMMGWSLGLAVIVLVLRYGTGVQGFAWSIMASLAPLAAIFYPVGILPHGVARGGVRHAGQPRVRGAAGHHRARRRPVGLDRLGVPAERGLAHRAGRPAHPAVPAVPRSRNAYQHRRLIILRERGLKVKRIAFSFDDVPLADGGLLGNAEERTAMLVDGLARADVPPVAFFVVAGQIGHPLIPHGERRIAAYTGAGHVIANHGFGHLALSDTPVDEYLADVDRAAGRLHGRPGFRPWFRYPYLDEGDTDPAKRAAVRRGLAERGLSNGYITVRSTDFHLDELAAAAGPIDRSALRDLHVELLLGSAEFYDRMAVRAIGRSPAHVLLLHENDLNALFIADVAAAFRRAGWEIVSADEAYADPIAVERDYEWNGSGRVVAMSIATGVPAELAYPPIEPGPLAEAFTTRVAAPDRSTRELSVAQLDTLFHDLVVLARPTIFVEGGAFEADTSLRVAAALPGCRVVAFEANPYVYERFSAARDFAAGSVEYVHRAMADAPGTVKFQVVAASASLADDRVQGYNSMLPRVGGDWLGDVEYEPVEVLATSLDIEFADTRGPAAMWLDVEGATGIVLAGAQTFLDRCDIVKIEVEEVPFWAGQWLTGDVIKAMAAHGLTPVARDTQDEDQYNVLFVADRLLGRPDVRDRLAEHRDSQR